MNTGLASAVYEGEVWHRRRLPHAHAFSYRIAQLYIDLDELDSLFANRWLWSVNRRNLAEFRRADYLGPATQPLAEAVRERVSATLGSTPRGPIRMLSHLRYAGHVFNPVTFYYCFAADGVTVDYLVAEITNTPWGERHAYVLDAASARDADGVMQWSFDKAFHVSPFMGMARRYQWRLTTPAAGLGVHMKVSDGASREFDATLSLQRRPLNAASLARVLWRYPMMTAQVAGAIHWQALRLWLKRNPVHNHPGRVARPVTLSESTVADSPGGQQ